MSKGIILDLCGGTGSWSKPYADAGYEVMVITLPKYDVLTAVFVGSNWIDFPDDEGGILSVPIDRVVGIFAAPPCTMFSFARTTARTPRDFAGAMAIVNACLTIIQRCRVQGSLKFWALENPTGYLRQFLGLPGFSFQPWQYGDGHFKQTDLWGYFKLPKPTHSERPASFDMKGWTNPKKPKGYEHLKLDRAAIRAITPPGFARAFYKANH